MHFQLLGLMQELVTTDLEGVPLREEADQGGAVNGVNGPPNTVAAHRSPGIGKTRYERTVMSKRTARLHAPADFGLAIQQARLDRGMSQQQLAKHLSVPQSTISEIEAGKSTIYLRLSLIHISEPTRLRRISY